MNDGDNHNPRQRILDAAVQLFARRGYAGTGVREIAREAGVNGAMINYYFGSKPELLKAIMTSFFDRYIEVVHEVLTHDEPLEARLRRLLRGAVEMFRANTELARVALLELPMDVEGLADFKAAQVRRMLDDLLPMVLPEVIARSPRPVEPAAFGPAVVSIIAWHFIMRPVIERIFERRFDEAFYEDYPEHIANLLLYGVLGTPPEESNPDTEG
jgi:TetR/AcrR family transcriptional regulator